MSGRAHITQTSNNLYEKKFSMGKNPRYGVGGGEVKRFGGEPGVQFTGGPLNFVLFPISQKLFRLRRARMFGGWGMGGALLPPKKINTSKSPPLKDRHKDW